jgi:DNA-binding CsgD family transcriptional regulator
VGIFVVKSKPSIVLNQHRKPASSYAVDDNLLGFAGDGYLSDTRLILDQLHRACLLPELMAGMLFELQAWLGSGRVRLVIEDFVANITPFVSVPNAVRLLVTVGFKTAHLSITLLPEQASLDQEKLKHIERQLRFSLGTISGINEAPDMVLSTRALIDKVETSMALFDGDGQILHLNPSAQKVFEQKIFGLSNPKDWRSSKALSQALGTALTSGQARVDIKVGGKIIKTILRRIVYPRSRFGNPSPDVCLAQFIMPDQQLNEAVERLAKRYNLSGSEAAVLKLCADGRSVAQIARDKGVGSETVRTQLRACRRKTQTHSQLELIALTGHEKRVRHNETQSSQRWSIGDSADSADCEIA